MNGMAKLDVRWWLRFAVGTALMIAVNFIPLSYDYCGRELCRLVHFGWPFDFSVCAGGNRVDWAVLDGLVALVVAALFANLSLWWFRFVVGAAVMLCVNLIPLWLTLGRADCFGGEHVGWPFMFRSISGNNEFYLLLVDGLLAFAAAKLFADAPTDHFRKTIRWLRTWPMPDDRPA